MRGSILLVFVLTVGLMVTALVRADRPAQQREKADYVVLGTVSAVYVRDTERYRDYIVELSVEVVEKGDGLKAGDTFRASCHQLKEGKGRADDTAGHTAVPKEGQKIKAFVNRERGKHEGVFPNWFDPIPAGKR